MHLLNILYYYHLITVMYIHIELLYYVVYNIQQRLDKSLNPQSTSNIYLEL